jgi:dienelactone hydrolase
MSSSTAERLFVVLLVAASTPWLACGKTGGDDLSGAAGTSGGGTGGGAGQLPPGRGGSPMGGSGASGVAGTAGQAPGGRGGGPAGGSGATDAGAGCTIGLWPASDPSMPGPFATVTENNVGPAAGVGVDGGAAPMFTLFRPTDLGQGGLCHPVITWGNGTGATPSIYKTLLNHLASHGFVVIASNSTNVAQGDPAPMLAGVSWVLEQNADPSSVMYQRIDTTHIGATGHSQGGFATTTAGADARITTIAPLCGATTQRNLHGPALLFCGGMDTTVPCSTVMNAYNGITNQPIMLASYLAADHANWITFRGTTVAPVEAAVTAWMRVHLMGDAGLRGRFYGPACTLCQDAAWTVMRKMMDQ